MKICKIGFALQYPSGHFAAIDMSSGGYPYKVDDPQLIWIAAEEELRKYLRAGNSENLKIVFITVEAKIG